MERRIHGLYVIIDPEACRGRRPLDVARQALDGGASMLQWRDKRRHEEQQYSDARAIAALCRERGALCIVNDYPGLALAAEADGVHVGQDDFPMYEQRLTGLRWMLSSAPSDEELRTAAPTSSDYSAALRARTPGETAQPPPAARRVIIGISTNTAEEARRAEAAGADYVAVGAIFPTQSKDTTRPASLERLREVKAAVGVPVVAIGGIDASNIGSVIEAGADAAAVISAVCAADDPRAAAAELSAAFKNLHGSTTTT